ncbi:GNAT family N-acetyltransferase [Amorphoplanes nipponensis]|uniref:N-acetyltransferase n=1 Tax=Actinoplanes nipponensis TaxID=135950 RepID=A0A919MQ45_9ACTN|nr:GNAT family N-acetyltransferase [Actinoplanes nipponensis]GIE53271.1 N-acetyltransferase [Actinoplanes nipponensis]
MAVLRPLTDADIDAVAAVHVRAWQIGYAGILPPDYLAGLDPAAFARHRRERTPPPGARTLVAVDDDTVIGFTSFGPYRVDSGAGFNPAIGELYAIYVDPARWSGGTGRKLLAAARAGLAEAGHPAMRLWVFADNQRARRFYERAGLTPDGARQFYTPRGRTEQLPEVRYSARL